MMNSKLHSAMTRYLYQQTDHWCEQLIAELRRTTAIDPDDSYRIFHETMGTPRDAEIKSALDAIPEIAHPSNR